MGWTSDLAPRLWRQLPVALTVVAAIGSGACASTPLPSPERADRPWTPTPEAAAAVAQRPQAASERLGSVGPTPDDQAAVAADLAAQLPGGVLGLPQAIDLALRNSPRTRSTWLAARAAAAEVGSQRSGWYPDINLTGDVLKQKGTVGSGIEFEQTTLTPALDLSWLLLDFGGRKADVEEARDLLMAAGFQHNAMVQDVVLDVSIIFYRYVSARALAEAARADLEAAERNLEAAERRHDAGLATIADVLQAKTAASQRRLDLQQIEGDMQVIRGNLATAMGLPADLPVEAAPLQEDVPVTAASETIEATLDRALAARPDLMAARARALAAEQRIAQERSEGLPTVSLRGATNRIHYQAGVDRDPSNNYSALVQVRVPLFAGFEHRYDVERARAEAAEAAANAEVLEQVVRLSVWTSYFDLQTAAVRYATTLDLLAAAEESARVAAGRYEQGVGSILDLLASQGALANARAQKILNRADWLLALARLAHDTGELSVVPVREESAP